MGDDGCGGFHARPLGTGSGAGTTVFAGGWHVYVDVEG